MGALGAAIGIPEAVALGGVISTLLIALLYARSPVLRTI
jgi:hypothetical protein